MVDWDFKPVLNRKSLKRQRLREKKQLESLKVNSKSNQEDSHFVFRSGGDKRHWSYDDSTPETSQEHHIIGYDADAHITARESRDGNTRGNAFPNFIVGCNLSALQ
ncbi:Uncharacterised protein g895 [Pycnogonum litorale]